jgi:hypothetical protein
MQLSEVKLVLYEELFRCYDEEDMRASSPHRGFRIIGDQRQIIYARSLWEANIAHYLQWLQEKGEIVFWQHEPRIFYFEGIKRGVTNYTPDFFVATSHMREGYWIEVKGYMDNKSSTKIKRFKKYYPDEVLKVIDKKWFTKNQPILKYVVPHWETEGKTSIHSKEEIEKLRKKGIGHPVIPPFLAAVEVPIFQPSRSSTK